MLLGKATFVIITLGHLIDNLKLVLIFRTGQRRLPNPGRPFCESIPLTQFSTATPRSGPFDLSLFYLPYHSHVGGGAATGAAGISNMTPWRALAAWFGGISLSWVFCCLGVLVLVHLLRRKGYAVGLGFGCLIFRAVPGSRRFPEGVEVRVSTRIVGFVFGGCRGPWLDLNSSDFCMRLRGEARPRRWARDYRVLSRFLAIDRGYWRRLIHNILSRIALLIVRGLRVRASKVRIWKDGADWEFCADTFVMAGCASGMFGSKYTLSLNEMSFRTLTPGSNAPVRVNCTRGIEFTAHLCARFISLLFSRRHSLVDDLQLSVDAHNCSLDVADGTLRSGIKAVQLSMSPRLSRSLRLKLPPGVAAQERISPASIIRAWEANAELSMWTLNFTPPSRAPPSTSVIFEDTDVGANCPKRCLEWAAGALRNQPDKYEYWLYSKTRGESVPSTGVFVRLDRIHVDAYGIARNEKGEPALHSSVTLNRLTAGSLTVDELSREVYERSNSRESKTSEDSDIPLSIFGEPRSMLKRGRAKKRHRSRREQPETKPHTPDLSSKDHLEKIVVSRPEVMFWIDELSAAMDSNMKKVSARQVEVGASGMVVALEPIGLASLVADAIAFLGTHKSVPPPPSLDEANGDEPVRAASSSSLASDSMVSIIRSASSSSLSSLEGEAKCFHVVAHLQHCRGILLGHGPVGDGDTIALIASANTIEVPNLVYASRRDVQFEFKSKMVKLLHWSQWDRCENVVCEALDIVTKSGDENCDARKLVTVNGLSADWDLDLQSAIGSVPYMLSILKNCMKSRKSGHRQLQMSPESIPASSPTSIDDSIFADNEGVKLASNFTKEEREHREKVLRTLRKISGWDVVGSNVSFALSFPDGPRLGISAGTLPEFALTAKTYFGEDCVLTLFESRIVYLKSLKLVNPLYTLGRSVKRPKIEMEGSGFRGVLGHDVELGSLIQDWLIRFRAVIRFFREERYRRAGIKAPPRYRIPTPDIFLAVKDIEMYLEDHPLAAFFTDMLPLFQDESRNRIERHTIMSNRMEMLSANRGSEIAASTSRCQRDLYQLDSNVWINRVRKVKECKKTREVAEGFLPPINGVPLAKLTADSLKFEMVMDEETHHEGSKESMRKLRFLDEYLLGPQKRKLTRQYEPDSWNSIGFRNVDLEARNVILTLRDYPDPFVKLDHAFFDKTVVGQGVQATIAPYLTETCVAVGRRRLAKISKGLGNTKTFADIHLVVDELTSNFNPAQIGTINDFGRACARFSSGGKNPSPRVPWFDTVRVSSHGRFCITAKVLKGTMASSNSPYTKTKHFTDIYAEDVRIVASRMKSTDQDRYPISFTLHNWHVRPHAFSEERRSDIGFECICVGLAPVPECYSGDPQDHYFIPIPSREDVRIGGPGIGRGTMEIVDVPEPVLAKMNPLGCYTDWTTGLHCIPDYDSYKNYKTRRLTLGIDVLTTHPKTMQPGMGVDINELHYIPKGFIDPTTPRYWAPHRASVLHSDGLSTLIKVIKNLVRRPISCRVPPRMIDHARKPPSITGLSSSLIALNLYVNVTDLNVMLYNNLQQGHGLFISVPRVVGELGKRAKITWDDFNRYYRDSKVSRRRVEVKNLNASIRMPDIDIAADETGTGRLLSVSRIFLSDDVKDEPQYAASPRLKAPSRVLSTGFGTADHDKSPFYTFSASHALQREKKLDKVKHDMRIAVDEVRLLWSPARRTSLWAWPDAFREKAFAMKAAPVEHEDTMQSEDIGMRFENVDSQIVSKMESSSAIDTSATEMNEESSENPNVDSISDVASIPKRTLTSAVRRPQGTMVDILNQDELDENARRRVIKKLHTSQTETLATIPKFEFLINSSQVCIGSPETTGLVFLTSDAARIGIVEKTIQRTSQTGTKNETWIDKEHRVHLKESNVYSQSTNLESFDFSAHVWVPNDAHRLKAKDLAPFTRVTTKPMSMDLMYISSSSAAKVEDGNDEDFSMRPSLLFINLRDISMASTSVEFFAVIDVVRKVLMQRAASSIMVKEELAKLRYSLQLRNRKITSKELDDKMRRLNTITKQFLYAADTSQEYLVDGLLLTDHTFEESLQRYKAKAKAVATFIRTDQRASTADYQYPTMYISYSFDKCSWELREMQENTGEAAPIVEIALSHLVCRHIFYVGRGSSAEITFKSIRAINRMTKSHFEDFLKPATVRTDTSGGSEARTIKASDGAPVAFRWYSTQTDKVGGISVYDLLTIQVAPLNAAVSRRLYIAVSKFIFPPKVDNSKGADNSGASSARSSQDGRESRSRSRANSGELSRQNSGRDGNGLASRMSDVTQMARRGDSTILFKYVFIDAFELTASFKNKEKDRSMLDFSNLFVTTPSFSYSSEIWTWKDFANRIKRDLVFTFARRGVSNLAKIKFIPGYSRARRKFFQSAETVHKTITNRLHPKDEDRDSDASNDNGSDSSGENDFTETDPFEGQGNEEHKNYVVRVLYGKRSIHVADELERIQEIVSDRVPQASASTDGFIFSASHRGVLPPNSADDLLAVLPDSQNADNLAYTSSSRPYRSNTLGSAADSGYSAGRVQKQGSRFWDRLRRR